MAGEDGDSSETPVGDGREKHVTVIAPDGKPTEHGDVYVKHTSTAFLISPDREFPDDETTRYEKADLLRAEISQHHAACFITTAAADETALADLRTFRDGTMTRHPIGRGLVWTYGRVSPPIARTLDRHPEARTTRVVRWLVDRCATIARRQREAAGMRRRMLAALLTALYVVGVLVAALGHVGIRSAELTGS